MLQIIFLIKKCMVDKQILIIKKIKITQQLIILGLDHQRGVENIIFEICSQKDTQNHSNFLFNY